MKSINVIGQGYIGLPTALMLASHGMPVVGSDYNPHLIESLQNGVVPIDEDGMDSLFAQAVENGITFDTGYQETDTYIVAVPTPYDKRQRKIDTRFVEQAVSGILDVCEKPAIVIIESTMSPGTIDRVVKPLIRQRGLKLGEHINLVHAPERIIPGNMIYELMNNSRTVGADSEEIANEVKSIYSTFCRGEILTTDIKSAEMAKVAENTFRDINIAYANELSKICHEAGIDAYEVIRLANKHPRVNILTPGPGVGGHCISVDPWFLVGDYPDLTPLIAAARKENDSMPRFVLQRIRSIMIEHEIASAERVGLYGLTYKENVGDIRESPTLQLLEYMESNLAEPLKVYDPFVKGEIVKNQYHNLDKFLDDIDLIVIMVAHDEIRDQSRRLTDKIVFDTRNIPELRSNYRLV